MFNCPKCITNPMSTRYKDKMPYLWCHKCDSTALSSATLKNSIGEKKLYKLQERAKTKGVPTQYQCPLCSHSLAEIPYRPTSKSRIKIDMCPRCSLAFLNPDELKALNLNTKDYEESADDLMEFEMVHLRSAVQDENMRANLMGLNTIIVKGKKLTDTPLVTIIMTTLCLFFINRPYATSKMVFFPSHPTLKTFFGHIFAHAGWGHLIGNLYFFVTFSSHLEKYIGNRKTFLLYIASVTISTLVYMKFGPNAGVVGLSGVVSCAMGAMIALFPQGRISFLTPLPSFRIVNLWQLKVTLPLYVYILPYFLSDIYFYSTEGNSSHIAYISHITGFACGFIILKATKDGKA